jgi:hypothetical protein
MPDPKRYTVRDPESGRTVTFAWSGDAPPTDDDMAEVFASVPKEAPLTLERQAPSTPSATEQMGQENALRDIRSWETPSDTAFLKRAPQVGETAGMVFGGPVGAAAGRMAGSLVKSQIDRGLHVPTTSEVAGAAGEGALSGALAGTPLAMLKGARTIGPAVAKNATRIGRAAQTVSGGGFGASVMSGNVPAMLATGATAIATDPRMIRGVGNLATRAGNAVPAHAANKAGFGLLNVKALLEALGADQASTEP